MSSAAVTTKLLAPIALLAALACAQRPAGAPAIEADSPAASASGRQTATSPAAGGIAARAVVTGSTASASGGFPAVVTLEPSGGGEAEEGGAGVTPPGASDSGDPHHATAPRSPVFMDQVAGAFYPPTLLVRAGQTVEFLNSEGVMHNVSVAHDGTGATVFNIATPPGFESYPHVFDAPGVYRVKCDIHPNMSAFIVGVASPYAAVADRDGRFTIHDVPPGSYRVSVWSLEVSRQVRRSIEIPSGSATVELDLRSPGLPK